MTGKEQSGLRSLLRLLVRFDLWASPPFARFLVLAVTITNDKTQALMFSHRF